MKKVQFIIISTILSLGLIVSSSLVSNAILRNDRNHNKITVKGVSEKKIKADRAILVVKFWRKSTSLEEGTELMEGVSKKINDMIPNLEINTEEYKLKTMEIKTNFIGNSNTPSSYEFNQNFVVNTRAVDKIENIYEKLKLLELEFNNLKVEKPEYSVNNLEKFKNDMLIEASKNANNKAFDMLKVTENSVGDLIQMTQSNFELLEDKEAFNDDNIVKENQKYKKLRVVVTATYSIYKIK